jgi:hypothetical protein
MRFLVLSLTLWWIWVPYAQAQEPLKPGVYVELADQWIPLKAVSAILIRTQPTRMIIRGNGRRTVTVFRNAHAQTKVLSNSPELFVRDVPGFGERDVLIVKLDVRRGRRELPTAIGENPSSFRSRLGRNRAPEFDARKISDHTFSIAPAEPLSRGEYMITVSPGMRGYEFAVQN